MVLMEEDLVVGAWYAWVRLAEGGIRNLGMGWSLELGECEDGWACWACWTCI